MRSEVRKLPDLFLTRLKKLVPSHKFDALANSFSQAKPTTFRINSLKTNAEKVREVLSSKGFQLSKISWNPNAFVLSKGRRKDLESTELYQSGALYVQSISSMIPPMVLQPLPGETILDLTAAPGGKTTQMAAMMGNEGKIVAVECNDIRFERMKANIQLQGAAIVEPVLGYGESFGNKHPEQFDRVLLDAPCSAEGRFLASEPSSYRYWGLHKVADAAKLQKKLIISALKALKAGGTLVYSTCTFSPEENEEVLQFALESFRDTAEMVPISQRLPNKMAGLSQWEGKSFHSSVQNAVRILPTAEMDGFFIARIQKGAS